jgi:hypothetical protein
MRRHRVEIVDAFDQRIAQVCYADASNDGQRWADSRTNQNI